MHTRQVGWTPTKQFEGKIAAGHVPVAAAREMGGQGPEQVIPTPLTGRVKYAVSRWIGGAVTVGAGPARSPAA